MNENKKLSTIYIYQILKEYSDDNHLLTQADIKNHLKNTYSLTLDRRAISRSINDLCDDQFIKKDIIKNPNGGCFLGNRTFEASEVKFLIDAIFSSRVLSSKQASNLSKKIYQDLSIYDRKDFSYIYKTNEINRTNNNQLFYNIESITKAIKENKKIMFNYNRFYVDKEKAEKHHHKKYIVSPYYMINSSGKYYLICNYSNFNDISNYRIELISNIEILDEKRRPINEIDGYEKGFNISDYANENIYMFNDNTITAEIKIEDEYTANYVVDWFGENAKIERNNETNEILATIKANEQSLIYWCLQYGEKVELLSPNSTRDKIKQIVKSMCNKYN